MIFLWSLYYEKKKSKKNISIQSYTSQFVKLTYLINTAISFVFDDWVFQKVEFDRPGERSPE